MNWQQKLAYSPAVEQELIVFKSYTLLPESTEEERVSLGAVHWGYMMTADKEKI